MILGTPRVQLAQRFTAKSQRVQVSKLAQFFHVWLISHVFIDISKASRFLCFYLFTTNLLCSPESWQLRKNRQTRQENIFFCAFLTGSFHTLCYTFVFLWLSSKHCSRPLRNLSFRLFFFSCTANVFLPFSLHFCFFLTILLIFLSCA